MLGFLIVLLAACFFCFQNVIVRVLFQEQTILGWVETGGFVPPTLHSSFLLMFMRMLLVVPLLAAVAPTLYPPVWQDIRQLGLVKQRPTMWRSLAGGCLMFLYLALLYISIGLIPTGIALTLFFTYPAFTAMLSWRLFGDRPTVLRWIVMGLVMVGSGLTMPHLDSATAPMSGVGVIMGLASGMAYALYTVVAQKSFETLHPVPFTGLSFAIALVLSSGCLLVWPLSDAQLPWPSLWIGASLSAIVTLTGHLLNNLGIQLIGATSASMVAASNPALTVVLAWLTIQETLSGVQLLGVALVTCSVALLSREHRPSP